MDTFKRFTKNSIYLLVAKGFTIIFSMAFGIYAARSLGDIGYGKYGFIMVMIAYFMVTSEFGLENLIVRDVATQKEKSNSYLATSILFKFATASISVLLMVGTIFLLGREDLAIIALLAAISLIPLSIYTSFDACFRAHEKMEYIAGVEIIYGALRSGLGIFLLMRGFDLTTLFAAYIGTECFRLLLITILYHVKISPLVFSLEGTLIRHFWKESVPLASWKMLGMLYIKIEVLILFILLGDASVGWFKVSMNITDLISIVSMIAMNAILPVMSNFYVESREKLLELYQTIFRYIIIIMIPVAMGITIFADDIIVFMFGDQYLNSVHILRILIWSAALSFILALLGTVILVIDKFRLAAKLSVINTIVRALLNIILISKLGFIGAPLASLIANAFSLALFVPVVSRTLGHTGIDFALIRSALISLGIVLAGLLLFQQYGYLYITILTGYLLYFIVIFKTRMVNDKKLGLVKQIFLRGN